MPSDTKIFSKSLHKLMESSLEKLEYMIVSVAGQNNQSQNSQGQNIQCHNIQYAKIANAKIANDKIANAK